MSIFKPATTSEAKLRLAIAALSGAGKSYTSLSIATGIASVTGDKIAVIDSEHGRCSKYAKRFKFDTVEPYDFAVPTYLDLMEKAGKAGYILIIDSLTHLWWELCDSVEKVAQTKYRGNTWSAWSDPSTGTPMQRKLVDAILSYPNHLIATMRVDTEWTQEEQNGRKRPVKVGLKPVQGKGIEYEFDLMMSMTADHVAKVEKDGADLGLQDQIIDKPGEEFGVKLVKLLGAEQKTAEIATDRPNQPIQPVKPGNEAQRKFAIGKIDLAIKLYKIPEDIAETCIAVECDGCTLEQLTFEQADSALPRVESVGRLNQVILDKGVTPSQIQKALEKLGVKKMGELSIEQADRMAEGIKKMSGKSKAA